MERILNLLVDEVEERLEARRQPDAIEPAPVPSPPVAPIVTQAEVPVEPVTEPGQVESEPEPEQPSLPVIPSHAARLMGRLALGLLVVIVVINIPFNRHGVTLATAMPDNASLIIRDGLVIKEENDEKIYVYQGGQFRWISSLDAFEHYRFTWGDVNIVEDGYLSQYEIGVPIHVLLKCHQSPHIYRLENGAKRWIRDIDTFVAEGHVWKDVRFVTCQYLRNLPDGETIPPDSGPPPQP
jgi:hypothetical protein